jgi:hypothetical protein
VTLSQMTLERIADAMAQRVLTVTEGRVVLYPEDIATITGIGEESIIREINKGTLRGQRPGKRYIVGVGAFFTWLENADINHLLAQSGSGQ